VFSVWVITSTRLGGLAFTSEEIATIFVVAGVSVIVVQLLAPTILDKAGPLLTYKAASFYFGSVSLIFPFMYLFISYGKTSLMIGVIILYIFRSAFNILTFTSLFLLVNHSVDSDLIGTANGMGQSTVSLSRGIGPLVGGFILSWSLSNGLDFPFDHYFSFFICSFGLFCTTMISFILPKSIDSRKK